MPDSERLNESRQDALDAALQAKLHNKATEEPTLTKTESNRLISLMEKDDEFKTLFKTYIEEISDPKNRAEQEAYLRQLEEQNEVPDGKQVLRPEPGFVLKFKYGKKVTESLWKNRRSSKKQRKLNKLFINVVYSKDIGKPTSKREGRTTDNAGSGTYWSLPYSLGPLRMEYDAGKDLIATFDCCFNPETLVLGYKSVEFRDLIATSCREGVMMQYQKMNDPVEIQPAYHVLKGVQYKNGDPSVMLISSSSALSVPNARKEKPVEAEEQNKVKVTEPETPDDPSGNNDTGMKKGFLLGAIKTSKKADGDENEPVEAVEQTIVKVAEAANGSQPVKPILGSNITAIKKGFLLSSNKTSNNIDGDDKEGFLLSASKTSTKVAGEKPAEKLIMARGGGKTNDGKVIPNYEVVEKGDFELIDHTIEGLKRPSTRPKYLEYRIALPRVKSAKCVDLDVSEDRLVLTSVSNSKAHYYLNIKLPYPVLFDDGTAKFDKSAATLTVTIPVCRPEPQAPWAPSHENSSCEPSSSKDELEGAELVDPSATDTEQLKNDKVQDSARHKNSLDESPVMVEKHKRSDSNHSRWLNVDSADASSTSTRMEFACDEDLLVYSCKTKEADGDKERIADVNVPSTPTLIDACSSTRQASDGTSTNKDIDEPDYELVEKPAMVIQETKLESSDLCTRAETEVSNDSSNDAKDVISNSHFKTTLMFELD